MRGTLFKPILFSWRNNLRASLQYRSLANPNVLLLLSGTIITGATYLVALNFFQGVSLDPSVSAIVPRFVFSSAFLWAFALLFISGAVNSFQAFFTAADLPLLHVSPIKPLNFFTARIILTVINSSWMLLLLLVPIVFAYQIAFELSLSFSFYAIFLLAPVIIAPCLLSFIFCLLLMRLACLKAARLWFSAVSLLLIVTLTLYLPILLTSVSTSSIDSVPSSLANINSESLLAIFNDDLAPSWFYTSILAHHLTDFSTSTASHILLRLTLCWLSIAVLFCTCFLLYARFYFTSWSHSLESPLYKGTVLPVSYKRLPSPTISNRVFTAIIKKELKLFLRDLSQSLQLFMLLLLTLVYIYNFRALREPTSSSIVAVNSWQTLLLVSNLALGAFVVAAIGARFIFPSVNLEGKSFILLRSAPITTEQIIKYKFLSWLIPLAFLLNLLFLSGALAIGANYSAMLTGLVIACSLSLTIASLGIGLGSVNLNFTWSSPSEIFNSSGAIAYMCSCFGVISLTIGLGAFPLALSVFGPLDGFSNLLSFAIYFCCFYIIAMTSVEFSQTLLRTSASQLEALENY